MDEKFNWFLTRFGPPTTHEPVSEATLAKFKGKLPDRLLDYWKAYGFCGFKDGLFWITNPDDYEPALEAWIGDTPIMEEDAYYVIARTAFGELYLWGTKTGTRYDIQPMHGWIHQNDNDSEVREIRNGRADWRMQVFFRCQDPEAADTKDEQGEFLFARAVDKLGPLAPDEIFAFAPALPLGGPKTLDHLTKVNIHVHLDLLPQMIERHILDRQALAQLAFGS